MSIASAKLGPQIQLIRLHCLITSTRVYLNTYLWHKNTLQSVLLQETS